MKKIYLLIIVFSFLLFNNAILAQCSVSISTTPNATQLDCKNTSIMLSANSGAPNATTYLWNTGDTTQSINEADSGTYTITATIDDGNCTTSSSIHITKDITTPIVSILAFANTICQGSSSTLVAIGAGTYTWQPGSLTGDTVLVTPGATTSYTVMGTDANGCTDTNTLKLVVNPLPDASISGDSTGCQYANEPGVTFTGSNGNGPYTFAYNIDGGLTQSVTTDTGNTVTILVPTGNAGAFKYNLISVTNGNGCMNLQSGETTVNIHQAPLFMSSKIESVCNNTIFNYTATSSVMPGTNFSWTRAAVPGISNSEDSGETATIQETLENITDKPIVVNYVFNLFTGVGCNSVDTVKVTVYPTPTVTPVHNYIYCAGETVGGINFGRLSNVSFKWTCNSTIGFGTSGSDSIPAFVATNTTSKTIVATIKVSTTTGNDCAGDSVTFTITVHPGPILISSKLGSVCDSSLFAYTAKSSAIGTVFSWTRDSVEGISNLPKSGSTDSISERLDNTTSQPVSVFYNFTLSTYTGCTSNDTLKVTINPTPTINKIPDATFCNGNSVSGIHFKSTSPDSSFTWNCNPSVGFGTSGSGSIPAFTATNTDTTSVVAKVTVFITASSDNCRGADSAIFNITVKPSPPRPGFTSFSAYPDNDSLVLCDSSENINFNVNSLASAQSSILYKWASVPDSPQVFIKDNHHPNTVISFAGPGTDTIKVVATDTITGCMDSASQVVHVGNHTKGIDIQKIFKMQPGNLLVYPDNSLNGYQWGYDSLIHPPPDYAFGAPVLINGQVYQFFIPEAKFITNDSLNELQYFYWVLLHNGGCYTKIYYNGPYDDKQDSVRLLTQSDNVQLQIIPNPNKGIFEIDLKGNIYGNIDAKIYNAMGQVVSGQSFVKTLPDVNEKFNTNKLPAGTYFLILNSSDLKQVGSRFIITH